MANTHKVIYVAASVPQAHMLKNALLEEGIFAYVTNDALQNAGGELPYGELTAPKVVVGEEDAEDAREIALAFDRTGRNVDVAGDDDETALDVEEAARWPRCPHCDRPRHTQCPVCETAGTSFPQAFMGEGVEDGPDNKPNAFVVTCPICDEVFEPQFLARCEWCGHRFQDGRELPTRAPAESDANYRVWIVVGGLVAFLAVVALVFAQTVSR